MKKEGKGEGERVSAKRQRREAKEERRSRKKARREEKRRKADHVERALAMRGAAEEGGKHNERDGEEGSRDRKHGRQRDERRLESKGSSFEDMFRAGSLGAGSEESRKKRLRAQEQETRRMDRREYKKIQKEESKSWRENRDY